MASLQKFLGMSQQWKSGNVEQPVALFDVSDINVSLITYHFNIYEGFEDSKTLNYDDDEFFNALKNDKDKPHQHDWLQLKKYINCIGQVLHYDFDETIKDYQLLKNLILIKDKKEALLNMHHNNYMVRSICLYVIRKRIISIDDFKVERLMHHD